MPSTYTPIATTTLGSAAASVTFSSISGAYTDLILVANSIRTTGLDNIGVRFNSDTGTNYSWTILKGDGSSASSDRRSSVTDIIFNVYNSTAPSAGVLQIQNYSNTTTNKTVLSRSSGASAGYVYATVGLWRSTSAITSITLFDEGTTSAVINTGSTFTLYGVKSA
jgi:hypothetical protein